MNPKDSQELQEPHLLTPESRAEAGSPRRRARPQPDGTGLQADLHLPDDIRPHRQPAARPSRVLLTGATGFLGRHVLSTLLKDSDLEVVCLVRANDVSHAADRVATALRGMGEQGLLVASPSRVDVVVGDLELDRFGLDEMSFARLAHRVDTIMHAGAEVSWVKPYAHLRASHVVGTREILRLACLGPAKAIYVASTLAVAYLDPDEAGRHMRVSENTDVTDHLLRLALPYARAKGVAEGLVREAARRGLPIAVLRLGLLCGDSRTGRGAQSDLISRLLVGTLHAGVTADVDWFFDGVPVDVAAQAMCRALAAGTARAFAPWTLHLRHDEPRAWRELVLALSVRCGRRIDRVPLEAWLEWIRRHAAQRAPELHAIKRFLASPARHPGGRPGIAEFLAPMDDRIDMLRSQAWLAAQGIRIPRLDGALVARYLDALGVPSIARRSPSLSFSVEDWCRRMPRVGDATGASWIEPERMAAGGAMLSELAALQDGQTVGLWRCRPRSSGRDLPALCARPLVLKIHASDAAMDAALHGVAGDLDPALGRWFTRHAENLPHRYGGVREQWVARIADVRLRRHAPMTWALGAHGRSGHAAIAMEDLSSAELFDSASHPQRWSLQHLETAARDLGSIHAVGWSRADDLRSRRWLALPGDHAKAAPLWEALSDFVADALRERGGDRLLHWQRRAVSSLQPLQDEALRMPSTLIHNDFNPRNLCFRREHGTLRLCAYDWELATVALPQTDLVELLCYVLPLDDAGDALTRASDAHRHALESAVDASIDPLRWEAGLRLALQTFLATRLPSYLMLDRVRAQTWLPGVLMRAERLGEILALPE